MLHETLACRRSAPRYCRARQDRKSTRVSFSLSRPTRPGDEIGGEVSASRTWWSTATRRWRVVDCQDAPAIRECLERRWLHELMRPSGRLGTLHARCHALARRRARIAFDLMEPERPKVDRSVLDFVKAHVFDPADFVIRIDGVCRLDPEMARTVVTRLWT